MRRLRAILALAALGGLLLFSQDVPGPFIRHRAAAGGACADTSCSGFLACQNFETATTGYDNSESWTPDAGTPQPAYTTTHLRGTQSLYLPTASTYKAITASGEVYAFFRWRPTAVSPVAQSSVFVLWNSGFSVIGEVALLDTNQLAVYNGSVPSIGSTTISAGTTYYVWVYWKKGTGSNGLATIWLSTTATKPGSPEATSVTTGTATDDAAYIEPRSTESVNAIFDQILVKTTVIGDVCP
jgi:hypothetical protein